MSYISLHNHLNEDSNIKMKDSTNKYDEFLDKALELGLKGVAITGHESLCSHVKAHRYVTENNDKFKDFQLILGNEIYLIDEIEYIKKMEANESIKFYHFILLAKDDVGYEQLKILSDMAWSRRNVYHGIERTPTFKQNLSRIVKENPGHIVASTACLGGELPYLIIGMRDNPEQKDIYRRKIMEFLKYMKELFGEDFYLEMQPSENTDQLYVNDRLRELGKAFNIKCICTTDSHYLTKAEKQTHKIFLRSRMSDDRETEDFYATAHLMSEDEIKEYFEDYETLKENTLEIGRKIKSETYSFKHSYIMPPAKMPENFDKADEIMRLISAPTRTSFEYIPKYYNSPHKIDQWYLKCLEEGLKKYETEITIDMLERIELELSEVWKVSESLNERVSQYFVVTKDIIDLMWKVSLVGVARGSSSCYYTNYLLGIVQISALRFNLPHWRFMSADRPTMPDKFLVWNMWKHILRNFVNLFIIGCISYV